MQTTAVSVLEANLAALGVGNPQVSNQVAAALPRPDLTWTETGEPGAPNSGALSATITEWSITGTTNRALASRRDPIREAQRLVETIDVVETPVVVVTGFGVGHHVREVAKLLGHSGVLVVFEPDVELLRSVFERIDHSEWIRKTNLLLVTDPDDEGLMANAFKGLEGVIAMGVRVVEHPASRARLGEQAGAPAARFLQRFTRLVEAARTTVATSMVQTEATLRNLTQNVDVYATCQGVGPLQGTAGGRPAIVVSAGPSLQRNIEQLSRPEVAERFVIIAVQTVLKPLLARGIRPHFVTALDFHEISRRFYEGLTEEDVRGITLVVEPKVNPAVTSAFPGQVRCTGDTFLDRLLGPDFTRQMGSMTQGATVAHLAYYLARLMGCDPVVMVGQDLGFTDGQYYAAGAAIHDVWAAELNEFNTLEMLEWQRIARMKGSLRRETDVLGRPIYTDEQMSTYLVQFQRDFKTDHDKGLTTIDATEGGVAKAYTIVKPLAEAIDDAAGSGLPPYQPPAAAPLSLEERRRILERVGDRLRVVRRDVGRIARECRGAGVLLREMRDHHGDQARVNRLISKVDVARGTVSGLSSAFSMVEMLNQTGVFNRARADRRLHLRSAMGGLTPMQVQREQIERDITNVDWMGDAADALIKMLEEAEASCQGAPKRTRDPQSERPAAPVGSASVAADASRKASGAAPRTARARVRAVIGIDPAWGGLGIARDLSAPVHGGLNALQMTLARLGRCRRLDGVTVVCPDAALARRLIGDGHGLRDLEITEGPARLDAWDPAVTRGARMWAADCWRGGLGNLTCYDEALWPRAALRAVQAHAAAAAFIVGPEWGLVDPALCDAVIERHQEASATNRTVFTQAAPGLAGCVIDEHLLAQIIERRVGVGTFASIGGLLGYVPTAPQVDFIARPMCVSIPAGVRDAARRCVLDTPARAAALLGVLASAGLDPLTAGSEQIAQALQQAGEAGLRGPRELLVIAVDEAGACIDPAAVERAVTELGAWAGCSTATITGAASLNGGRGPDVLDHPDLQAVIDAARLAAGRGGAQECDGVWKGGARGIGAVQIRTTLRGEAARAQALLASGAEVIGVDLAAEDRETYLALCGVDAFGQVRENLKLLITGRPAADAGGAPIPWVVPRINRRDAVYEQIEGFYDYWTLMAGAAVIDPPAGAGPGERITPLPLPRLAAARRAAGRIEIRPGERADGGGGR